MSTTANQSPIFPYTVVLGQGVISGACTDRTGGTTANLVNLFTCSSNGTKFPGIHFHAQTATVTNASCLVFVQTSGGSTPGIIGEQPVTATTAAGSTAAWNADWQPILVNVLSAGSTVFVGQTVAQNVCATAVAGQF